MFVTLGRFILGVKSGVSRRGTSLVSVSTAHEWNKPALLLSLSKNQHTRVPNEYRLKTADLSRDAKFPAPADLSSPSPLLFTAYIYRSASFFPPGNAAVPGIEKRPFFGDCSIPVRLRHNGQIGCSAAARGYQIPAPVRGEPFRLDRRVSMATLHHADHSRGSACPIRAGGGAAS